MGHRIEPRWLFDSHGRPIAFVSGDCVFTGKDRYLGQLREHEVWHGTYKGEVLLDDRLLYDGQKYRGVTRAHGGTPPHGGVPIRPQRRASVARPAGFSDLELDG